MFDNFLYLLANMESSDVSGFAAWSTKLHKAISILLTLFYSILRYYDDPNALLLVNKC